MGSGSSKLKRKVADIEEELSTSAQVLIDRENELNGKTEQLNKSKQLEEGLSRAKEALRLQIQELSTEWEIIEKEREKQIRRLKSDVAAQAQEADEHRRTASTLKSERDNEHTRATKLEKSVESLEEQLATLTKSSEDRLAALTKTSDEQRAHLQQGLDDQKGFAGKSTEELSALKTQHASLLEENRKLTQSGVDEAKKNEEQKQAFQQTQDELALLRDELETTKTRAAETEKQLQTTRDELATAESGMTNFRKQAAADEAVRQAAAKSTTNPLEAELVVTRRQLTASKEYVASMEKEMASAKASLQHSESMRSTAQRGQNESITRSSALHEAFTALKMELLDSQRAYRSLEEECQSLRLASRAGGGQSLLEAKA